MIIKFLIDVRWNLILKRENDPENILIIKKFLKHDTIDPDKFNDNYDYLINPSSFDDNLGKLKITPSTEKFTERDQRPFGYELWFIAAYPDVVYWYGTNLDKWKGRTQFEDLFDSDKDFEDKFMINGKFNHQVLRRFIDFYVKGINSRLECRP